MAKKKTKDIVLETTERQKRYVAEQEAKGGGLGLVFADAFIRGMRDIGYKDSAWALCEELDNSVQADASVIAIRFGYGKGNKSKVKPDMIAVVDNGVGMIPKMISYAVRWGGTDREDNRKGFGRYGYGLPSSAVSFCKIYTVYSKVKERWNGMPCVWISMPWQRRQTSLKKTNQLLQPQEQEPPDWVMEKSDHFDPAAFESGTIIIHDNLDRLEWSKTDTIKTKLLQMFGVNYRHWLPSPKIVVDDTVAIPVDPLFLMENGRHFDATSVMAQRIETKGFEVETQRGTKGLVKVRASYLPPNFHLDPPNQTIPSDSDRRGLKRHKGRFEIMKDYNGLLICREGRQIDCISPRWTKFQNLDQHVKIEIDFDPELDEFFGITTAKQQITIDEVLWDKLEAAGGGNLRSLVKEIRGKLDDDDKELKGKRDNDAGKDGPRPSEKVMADTEKFKSRPDTPSDEKKAEAQKELENTATVVSETTGRPSRRGFAGTGRRDYGSSFRGRLSWAIPEGPVLPAKIALVSRSG